MAKLPLSDKREEANSSGLDVFFNHANGMFGPSPELIDLTVSFSVGVASGVVANWLYSKLKGNGVTHLVIERKVTKITEHDIEKVIEECITKMRK